MERIMRFKEAKSCPEQFVLALNDTMNVLTGKWKLPILGSLLFGLKRFTDIQRNIPKITPRMLSKELKEMELNKLVSRTVKNDTPVLIEYKLTDYAKTLWPILQQMIKWGKNHRKEIR